MSLEHDLSGLGGGIFGGNVPLLGMPSSPPPVLGTDQLQKAIDKFDQAVEKLAKLYDKASGSGFSGGGGNGGGGFLGSSGGGGFYHNGSGGFLGGKYNIGHFAEEVAGIAGFSIPFRGPMRHAYGNWGGAVNGGYSGSSTGFIGQHTFNGQPMGSNSGSAGQSGFLGQHTFSGQPMGGSGGGGRSGGGGFLSGRAPTGAGFMASGALSLMSGISGYGAASLPIQNAMSSFQQQGTLLAPSNVSNFGVYGDQMRTAAFGGRNASPNNFAMNAQDAAQGYSTLQQMSGAGIVSSNSTGRFGLGAAASFAGANPDMGYG
jgi:hypothetical protein